MVILSTKSAVTSYFIPDTDCFCHVFLVLFFVSPARGLDIFILQDSGSYLNLILLDFSNISLAGKEERTLLRYCQEEIGVQFPILSVLILR